MAERDDKGRWIPGTGSPNPSGPYGLSPELRQLKNENRHDLIIWTEEIKNETVPMIQRMMGDSNQPVAKIMLCSAFIKAANGDIKALRLILEYLVGKPVNRVELSGVDGDAIKLDDSRAKLQRIMQDPEMLKAADILQSKLAEK